MYKNCKIYGVNLYFVTFGDNLSLPMNLLHEDKSAKVCPIDSVLLRFTGCRVGYV